MNCEFLSWWVYANIPLVLLVMIWLNESTLFFYTFVRPFPSVLFPSDVLCVQRASRVVGSNCASAPVSTS